jgi:hypothetical protein
MSALQQAQGENVKKLLPMSCISAALLLTPHIANAQCNNSSPQGPWGFETQGFIAVVERVEPSGVVDPHVSRTADGNSAFDSGSVTVQEPFAETGGIVFDGLAARV